MEASTKKRSVKKPTKTAKVSAPAPHLRLYRRIAVTFVSVTFLTLLAVMYLSFSRATIHITPEPQNVSTSFLVDVLTGANDDTVLDGKIVSNVFEQAKAQEVTGGSLKQTEAKAGGMVTIYNTTTKDQPLVATTRLLTADNILFRIDEGVNVPAGGNVQVMAHADQPGASGDIAPTTFTIPGLNPSLQTVIYAKSTEAFTGGIVSVKVVTQEDLDAAGKALEEEMLAAAKETLRLEAEPGQEGEVFLPEVLERKTDTPIGTETNTVMVSLKMRVVGVFFSQDHLHSLVKSKVYEQLAQGVDVQEVSDANVQLAVDRYDVENQLANLKVTVTVDGRLSPTSTLLDKTDFLGKSAQDVKKKLEASGAIKSVDIDFTPFWLKRMPTLKDHIKIVIE